MSNDAQSKLTTHDDGKFVRTAIVIGGDGEHRSRSQKTERYWRGSMSSSYLTVRLASISSWT